jgi:hypothetical protein
VNLFLWIVNIAVILVIAYFVVWAILAIVRAILPATTSPNVGRGISGVVALILVIALLYWAAPRAVDWLNGSPKTFAGYTTSQVKQMVTDEAGNRYDGLSKSQQDKLLKDAEGELKDLDTDASPNTVKTHVKQAVDAYFAKDNTSAGTSPSSAFQQLDQTCATASDSDKQTDAYKRLCSPPDTSGTGGNGNTPDSTGDTTGFNADDCADRDGYTLDRDASTDSCVYVEKQAAPSAPDSQTGGAATDGSCSNQGVRADSDPAVQPAGITFNGDPKGPTGAYIMHVWSNFRESNLNPQNFPPSDGTKTDQHEFILLIKYGEKTTLPPGTGGSIWRYDCDAMAWADYNREQKLEGFYPITVDQIMAYYNSGNPWGAAASTTQTQQPETDTNQSTTCSMDNAQVVDHSAVKGQTWTLPGNKAWVVHYWSNQHDPNLNTQSAGVQSKQNEFIYMTSIQTNGSDVVLPVGSGGKAWGYDCDSAAQADVEQQKANEGFVSITWEQIQAYANKPD